MQLNELYTTDIQYDIALANYKSVDSYIHFHETKIIENYF